MAIRESFVDEEMLCKVEVAAADNPRVYEFSILLQSTGTRSRGAKYMTKHNLELGTSEHIERQPYHTFSSSGSRLLSKYHDMLPALSS